MKNFIILFGLALVLAGCSTRYATVEGKDIVVKVRSIWADVDYDSRVCSEVDKLKELKPIGETELTKLKELE